jgi:hypothetical protein
LHQTTLYAEGESVLWIIFETLSVLRHPATTRLPTLCTLPYPPFFLQSKIASQTATPFHPLAYLQTLPCSSQFIVIFPNGQTIADADALYGVTMEKRSISKIVSMRFRSDLERDTGGR